MRVSLEDTIHQRYVANISKIINLRGKIKIYKKMIGLDLNPDEKVKGKIGKKQSLTLINKLSSPFKTRNNICTCEPTNGISDFKASLDEKLINQLWRTNKFSKKHISNIINSMVFDGTTFIEVGWKYKELDEVLLEIEGKEIPEQINIMVEQSNGELEIVTTDDKIQVIKKDKEVNEPFVDVHTIDDVIYDFKAKKDKPLSWFMIEQQYSYEELLLNDLIDDDLAKKIYNKAKKSEAIDETDDIDDDKKNKISIVKYYGYEQKDTKNIPILALCIKTDNDNFEIVKKIEEPLPFRDIPIVPIKLFDIDTKIHGYPLEWAIMSEDKFNHSIKRAIVDNLSNSNYNRTFYKKDSLTPKGVKDYLGNKPLIEVRTRDRIQDVIQQGNFNPLPQSIFALLQQTDYEASAITGVNQTVQGIGSTDLKAPASNFAQLMQNTNTRLDDFISNITDALKTVFMMWSKCFAEYYDDNDILKILNINMADIRMAQLQDKIEKFGINDLDPQTAQKAKIFLAKEIEKKISLKNPMYDIVFNIASDGLKQARANQDMVLIQQLAPLAQTGAIGVEQIKLVLSDMAENMERYKLSDSIKKYKPQPDPIAQQMAQLELQAKQAEIQEKMGKTQKEVQLAANAEARTELTKVKAQKDAATFDTHRSKELLEVAAKAKELGKDNENEKQSGITNKQS